MKSTAATATRVLVGAPLRGGSGSAISAGGELVGILVGCRTAWASLTGVGVGEGSGGRGTLAAGDGVGLGLGLDVDVEVDVGEATSVGVAIRSAAIAVVVAIVSAAPTGASIIRSRAERAADGGESPPVVAWT